jgi:hypothetical protein
MYGSISGFSPGDQVYRLSNNASGGPVQQDQIQDNAIVISIFEGLDGIVMLHIVDFTVDGFADGALGTVFGSSCGSSRCGSRSDGSSSSDHRSRRGHLCTLEEEASSIWVKVDYTEEGLPTPSHLLVCDNSNLGLQILD